MEPASPADIVADARKRGRRIALIVTALDVELQAVLAHVDDVVPVIGRKGAIYECGVFREGGTEWLVAIVECGAGNHSAQDVVTNAHIDFSPELQIFVGVAGSRKKDVPVGSVVAADHVYNPYGGKYDEHGFSARPCEFEANPRLLNVARKVRRDKIWVTRIKDLADRKLPVSDDYPCDLPPIATIAPAVSTEAVSADKKSELEALIAKNYGDATAVEMEGYGALFAASREEKPAIVIRGISDMTEKKDPETDKIRQPVAAAHAAAFAFETLATWTIWYPLPKVEAAEFAAPPTSDLTAATAVPASAKALPEHGVRYVLNLDADLASVPATRIAEIEIMLRELAAEPGITVEGIEEGSVRLIVRDPTAALEGLGLPRLKEELETRLSLQLLGLVPEPSMRDLADVAGEFSHASHDLLSWPDTVGGDKHFERPELDQLLASFSARTHSVTTIIGEPGSGKSALLATLGKRLTDQGAPVLAIKADLLDSSVSNEADLREWLGLSDRPSVLLKRMAQLRPTYLLIDQLDALAGYLDLRTGRLSALLNLIRKLGRSENIHIVLSARKFEYEHDVRLRSIAADSLQLQLPAWSQVLSVLEQLGIMAAGWPADAQEVLRSPQALATYLQLEEKVRSEALLSYQTMLDRLWEERVLAGPRGADRSRFATELADMMAEQESLWMPKARFDEAHDHIDALVSAGILALNASGTSIGFAHQTVFDYAMARAFAREPGRLTAFVLERQASIFSRPKVWSGLTYLRGADPTNYAKEIALLWSEEGLRRHLRLLLIEFLGQQREPSDVEASLLAAAFTNGDNRAAAFRAVTGSPGWFRRLSRDVVPAAMERDEHNKGWAASLLGSATEFAPDDVADLLERHWANVPADDLLSWSVIQQLATWSDRMLAIGEKILRRTQIAPLYVDHLVGTVGATQPEAALRLVRASLDRFLKIARELAAQRLAETQPADISDEDVWLRYRNDPRRPIKDLFEGANEWDTLGTLAEQFPSQTLDALWPWFVEALQALADVSKAERERPSYNLALEADFRVEDEHGFGLPEHSLLASLRIAAVQLAATDPAGFRLWMAAAVKLDFHPAQRLVAHAMSVNADQFATDAFNYLEGDVRRLQLGCLEDPWITSQHLVAAVAPYWSDAQVASFEAHIRALKLDLPPDLDNPQDRRRWHDIQRRLRVRLLRALPKNSRSRETAELLRTEERVIGQDRMRIEYSNGYSPAAIMSAGDMSRAKDDDILNAFRRMPDATEWDHPSDFRKGGNIQLSREFANFAKSNPERAVRLISQFEPDFGARAAGYAIDSLAADVTPMDLQALILDLISRGFSGGEFRNSVTIAFEDFLDRDASIDPNLLQTMIDWVLSEAPDPASDRDDEEAPEDDDGADAQSLLWGRNGITVVPGGPFPLMHAIVRHFLIVGDFPRLREFLERCLALGFEPRVWAHLLPTLRYLRPAKAEDAAPSVALIEAIVARYPILRGTRELALLLAHIHWWAADLVERELAQWGALDKTSARQGYGELVTLLAFVQPDRDWAKAELHAIELEGASEARVGALMTAINLWGEAAQRDRTTALIVRIITNADDAEWHALFDLFRIVDELPADENTALLLEAIADHVKAAPRLDATFVVDRLQALLPHEATLVARLAIGLVDQWHADLGDIRTSTAAQAPELVDLAVTLHRLGPATREAGTKLFEMLLDIDAYAARSTLDEIDNRFRSGPPRRPRLPRRRRENRRHRTMRPAESRGRDRG